MLGYKFMITEQGYTSKEYKRTIARRICDVEARGQIVSLLQYHFEDFLAKRRRKTSGGDHLHLNAAMSEHEYLYKGVGS